jgi:hypothetical protein
MGRSPVSTVTRLRDGRPGFNSREGRGWDFFIRYRCVQTGSGAHPASIQWVPEALSLGIKRRGREADHLPQSSAQDKNAWNYTSNRLIRLHGVVLS